MEILQWILGLGASVMLPIIMFVFAMIMGAGFTKSFRSKWLGVKTQCTRHSRKYAAATGRRCDAAKSFITK